MKTVKLTPKASQDLEDIWYYGQHHFGEQQTDRYINQLSDIFQVMSAHSSGSSSDAPARSDPITQDVAVSASE
ncbi:hypothetical protein BZK42_24065 [Citrobacter braakii]|uniref:Type II toxin-antitoxin system RelE/ParE family toxin n=1 Tax=Citrobacter braakii TaxID=57706 RepID=A0A1V8NT47_CITBR|nr:hypothetical protein BZK42_24065 [Citrobacter braakii]